MAAVEAILETAPGFAIAVEPAREVAWVKLAGELDLASCPVLSAQVAELVGAGFERLVIDLRGVSFLDVAGVRLLLSLTDQARRERWGLSLIEGSGQVRRAFALTGTLTRLPFCSPSHS